jgi:hypothetical protein
MRFLVDECTGPAVARWLVDQAHDVYSVYDEARGMPDEDERSASKIAAIRKLLDRYADQLTNAFVVVTEAQVRFGRS